MSRHIIEYQEETTSSLSKQSMEAMPMGSLDSLEDEVVDFEEPSADTMEYVEDEIKEMLPGSNYVIDFEEEMPAEEPAETSWAKDRDVGKFMDYLKDVYPDGIPKHDGYSIVGCEKAYNYLNRLNKEISEAIRMDTDDDLATDQLENVRVNMMKDMMVLKNRISDLKQKVRKNDKKAEDLSSVPWKDATGNDVDLSKEASSPIVQTVATPFQRAIVGMLINSVVSGGKPFEEVYAYLKEKYAFDDRDELSIIQLAMDSGFPIFKDRGTIGNKPGQPFGFEGHGVDFIKNYLA